MVESGVKWGSMVNKYGFPVKNYFVQVSASGQAAGGSLALLLALNVVSAIQKVLVEKVSVPRRVSAYHR